MIKSSGNLFRSKIYEPVFKNVLNSVNGDEYCKEVLLRGGSSSGKSINIANQIVFWLAREQEYAEALVIVYSRSSKGKTKKLFESVLKSHGFLYNVRKIDDGDFEITFAQKKIVLKSVETNSIATLDEKFKGDDSLSKDIKFIWYEELTAVLTSFRELSTFDSVRSRLVRLMKKNAITFFSYNPPQNKKHIVYDWQEEFEGLEIKSTIFDLPEKWQDENTLEEAERVRRVNEERFEHLYMGNPTLKEGLAFDINYDPYIDSIDFEHVKSIHVQTDEAIRNATAFAIYAWTDLGELVLLNSFYYKADEDLKMKSLSEFARIFKRWLLDMQIRPDTITTDGLDFSQELKSVGFENAKHIGKLKSRTNSYELALALVNYKKLKILRGNGSKIEENGKTYTSNDLLLNQLEVAKLTYDKNGRAKVDKKYEGTSNKESEHFHIGDTLLYTCLILKNEIRSKHHVI